MHCQTSKLRKVPICETPPTPCLTSESGPHYEMTLSSSFEHQNFDFETSSNKFAASNLKISNLKSKASKIFMESRWRLCEIFWEPFKTIWKPREGTGRKWGRRGKKRRRQKITLLSTELGRHQKLRSPYYFHLKIWKFNSQATNVQPRTS